MQSQLWAHALAVLLLVCRGDAYPAYPESDNVPEFVPTDFKLEDNAVGFIPDNMPSTGLRQSRNLNSALSALEEGINQIQKAGHWKEGKETLQEDTADNLVEDVKAILWQLAAAKHRSQGFTKSDQTPPKPNKRG
ncbi:hypothetical protein Y1Q_0007394 [Alligator mississippiensis]|uniref:Uncharacterized protein n=1 Tax=Alligator mississippiensis TaxID=8496 RepID=A0A151P7S8_ALLMI|nr:hypothetical protein Y1Q_0007394 [Alligator mississippiensis]